MLFVNIQMLILTSCTGRLCPPDADRWGENTRSRFKGAWLAKEVSALGLDGLALKVRAGTVSEADAEMQSH